MTHSPSLAFAPSPPVVNDAPVLAGTVGGVFTETVLDAGATLSVGFGTYLSGDPIGFPASFGVYTFDAGTGDIRMGGMVVGQAVGGSGGPLVVTFTASASNAVVNEVRATSPISMSAITRPLWVRRQRAR